MVVEEVPTGSAGSYGRSWSPWSSTATTAGAICRRSIHRTLRTVAMGVLTLIACASNRAGLG